MRFTQNDGIVVAYHSAISARVLQAAEGRKERQEEHPPPRHHEGVNTRGRKPVEGDELSRPTGLRAWEAQGENLGEGGRDWRSRRDWRSLGDKRRF